jgi:hypothetical protein
MDEHDFLAEQFEENRTHLRAVAYRMLDLAVLDDLPPARNDDSRSRTGRAFTRQVWSPNTQHSQPSRSADGTAQALEAVDLDLLTARHVLVSRLKIIDNR